MIDPKRRVVIVASDPQVANQCSETFLPIRETMEALNRHIETVCNLDEDDPKLDDKFQMSTRFMLHRFMQQYPTHAHFQADMDTLRSMRKQIHFLPHDNTKEEL